jgi:hypothetical protein
MKKIILLISFALFVLSAFSNPMPDPIVFNTPAKNETGIMILGNGELGATAWIDTRGTMHVVFQNSDSWNEGGRHVKTGAIDYITNAPVDDGTFRQELSMANGEFSASWKSKGKDISISLRIQQGTDSLAVCNIHGVSNPTAKVVNWRLYKGGSKKFGVGEFELNNRFAEGKYEKTFRKKKFIINADQLIPNGWYHLNRNETVKEMMAIYDYYQATGDLGKKDLLSNRVFGGITRTQKKDKHTLFLSAITCLHPCYDQNEWLRRTNEMLNKDGWDIDDEPTKRKTHISWWHKFWERSYIIAKPAKKIKKQNPFPFPRNMNLPISFGLDSTGKNRFHGKFEFAEVEIDGKTVYSGIPKTGEKINFGKTVANEILHPQSPSRFRFACKFSTKNLNYPQRLLDNLTPGLNNGFLVDIYQKRIRFILRDKKIHHTYTLSSNQDVSIEVLVPDEGDIIVKVNGKICSNNECDAITRCYAAQRYVNACAGRGKLPIRFNGSIFTISYRGDPDYRKWGHGYWWQNTRLPYYTMFASGDFDMIQPLFNMYLNLLEFNKRRTQKYLNHKGAYFPECMQPWGDHFIGTYGPICKWEKRTDKLQESGFHKYEWVGQLELSLMLLKYYAYTGDTKWFLDKALPSIREYVRYFDEHYKLDASGKYLMHPSQAVETWWNCTNPMPEISGLIRVTQDLLALPENILSKEDKALFSLIHSRIPDLPTGKKSDKTIFLPAQKFSYTRNVETPELYCVFPFRLSSFEKSNVKTGRNTFAEREHKHYFGWAQDEINAAYLGIVDEARKISKRALTNSKPIYRWPSYWGPHFNWTPDQDDGGIFLNTVQSMLLQYEGDKIFIKPCWPNDWDCEFKLHAPKNTTIKGKIENGEIKKLSVSPESRRKDIVICH